ncbi:MAG: helix-turn-helix domain-containing protein [bacterium]
MESIGVKLRTEREAKGYSLKDVSAETKISVRYLQALEDDDYDAIPGEAYVKAFMRSYARFLGIESDELVQKYEYSRFLEKNEHILPPEDEEKTKISLARVLLALLIIAALGTGIWLSTAALMRRGKPSEIPAGREQPRSTTQTPTREATPKAEAQPPKPGIVFSDDYLHLTIHAIDKSWVRILSDGQTENEKGITLNKGNVKTWRAINKFVVDIGNAGGVEVELNGRPMGVIGSYGERVDGLTFTRDNLKGLE